MQLNPSFPQAMKTATKSTSARDKRQDGELVRARTAQATILTVISIALAVGFYTVFGLVGLMLFGAGFPVSLWLLWQSVDVVRSDER
jgi:hypothetical protein